MTLISKVIVIGLDGLDAKIVETMIGAGELPNLAKLMVQGGFSRVATTLPAQTPVAWSTFLTGANPGGHGIFDFIRRDPKTYLPDFSLNRYEQKSAYLPPTAINLRRGTPLWNLLSQAGIPATIIRCPCTFPPDAVRGRMLAGMGVPDLRGGLGTPTFYSSQRDLKPRESENVVSVKADESGVIKSHIIGPRDPKTRSDFHFSIRIHTELPSRRITVQSEGQPKILEIQEGEWSNWLKVKFKTGLLQSVSGMVRFYLVRLEPIFELYASPINFDPDAPMFPISSPPGLAKELSAKLGTFYTTGMVEDHNGLSNERFSEAAYLDQCDIVLEERQRMMLYELERLKEGMFFCLFDTPDRVQHMFWRFRESQHPANRGDVTAEMARVIEGHYSVCDAIVGKALEYVDDRTLFIALSDHGFNSFQRGFHLNSWLCDNGLLTLNNGIKPGEDSGEFFRNVDWSRTKAYALGLGSIYLNLKGREEKGTVEESEQDRVKAAIVKGLTGMVDSARGTVAVRRVITREEAYTGPYAEESPDLLVNFNAGYRVSWATALGGIPEGQFEDNLKKWGGDHIIDPALVPGVLFMNQKYRGEGARLVDLAPTILAALKVPKGPAMEGETLLV